MPAEQQNDNGYTVIEVMIASAILIVALAGFFGALSSLQQTSAYAGDRSRYLDDLRITATAFGRDARHAKNVVTADNDRVVMQTFVRGTLKQVTYRVVSNGGEINLERLESGVNPRLFVIRLTNNTIFRYYPGTAIPAPQNIRRVRLEMETRPSTRYPPIALASEVSLRNVSG